jgi:hypothetical protein
VPRCWLLTGLLLEGGIGLRVESGNGEEGRKERSSLQEGAAVVLWRAAVDWWRETEGSGAQ